MSDIVDCLDHAETCCQAAAGLSEAEKAVLLRIAREWQSTAIQSTPPAPEPTVWAGRAIATGCEL